MIGLVFTALISISNVADDLPKVFAEFTKFPFLDSRFLGAIGINGKLISSCLFCHRFY